MLSFVCQVVYVAILDYLTLSLDFFLLSKGVLKNSCLSLFSWEPSGLFYLVAFIAQFWGIHTYALFYYYFSIKYGFLSFRNPNNCDIFPSCIYAIIFFMLSFFFKIFFYLKLFFRLFHNLILFVLFCFGSY